MDKALLGFLIVFGIIHFLLIVIPVIKTLEANITTKSKLTWCGLLIFLPLIGAAILHYRYKIGLFDGATFEISAAEERARSGTMAPHDHD
jgi:hypothetical protein